MGDVPAANFVLLSRYEPEAAEHCHGALALVEADSGFNRPVLAQLHDQGMTTVPRGGSGHPIDDALEQKGGVSVPLSELHAARDEVRRARTLSIARKDVRFL